MQNLKFKIIFEDESLLVIDKPAGITVFPEMPTTKICLIDLILEKFPALKNVGSPPRYGIIHRLDKNTSGIILVAKNNRSLEFFQKQFKVRNIVKRYTALVIGKVKDNRGIIETLLGRSKKDKRKQKVFSPGEPGAEEKRKAITEYRVLEKFENYTLLEVTPKTGRKHQIRAHLVYLGHPIAGDELYGFKNQFCPAGLKRQFLHASYLKVKLSTGEIEEFHSELPLELKIVLRNLKILNSKSEILNKSKAQNPKCFEF